MLPRWRIVLPAAGEVLDVAALFPGGVNDLWLEVGFGAGEHLAAQAAAHPDIGFIGCEPFVNGVAALLARASDDGSTNIRLFDDDARRLIDALPPASVGRVFILFPDPWPKKRHHRRRFISDESLDCLARVMADGAELRFASDQMAYVRWTLERLTRHPAFVWSARGPADWRLLPDDGFRTRYQAKAEARGLSCVYLRFRRCPRS